MRVTRPWGQDSPSRRFDEFVRLNGAGLIRSAYLVTWTLDEAQDVVQEALLRTSKQWSRVELMEFPLAYVRKIVFNLALKEKSRATTERTKLDSDALNCELIEPRFEAELDAIDTRSDIVAMLATLTRTQRAVIVLRYFNDFSEIEIANILELPVGTVKSTASRALAHLRGAATNPEHAPNSSVFHIRPIRKDISHDIQF